MMAGRGLASRFLTRDATVSLSLRGLCGREERSASALRSGDRDALTPTRNSHNRLVLMRIAMII